MPSTHAPQFRRDQTDQQLMAAYRNGENAAFCELYRRYSAALTRYFRRSGMAECDAQDLVQQTFMRLHSARDSYRPGKPLRSWLYVIARNAHYDNLRRRRRRPEVFCDPDRQGAGSHDDGVVPPRERIDALTAALAALPSVQRKLLVTRWVEDRSWSEIAALEGVPAGTLRVRAHRACVQLRTHIETEASRAPHGHAPVAPAAIA